MSNRHNAVAPSNENPRPAGRHGLMGVLTQEIVRQNSLAAPLHLAGGSRVHAVPPGWQSRQLANSQDTIVVETAGEFRAALDNPDSATILVAGSSPLNLEWILAVCEQAPLSKTIFVEQPRRANQR